MISKKGGYSHTSLEMLIGRMAQVIMKPMSASTTTLALWCIQVLTKPCGMTAELAITKSGWRLLLSRSNYPPKKKASVSVEVLQFVDLGSKLAYYVARMVNTGDLTAHKLNRYTKT